MTCDQALRLVEKLADGEATPKERGEAESHLESCEDCRSHYQFVRALESVSDEIDWPEPPEAYWQQLPSKVLARIENEPERRSFWQALFSPALLRFGAVAATLTVVVAVGFSVLEDSPAQLEPQVARAPSSAGKRQPDEKAARAPEAPSPEPEAFADMAPSPAVGLASEPSEQVARPRAETVPPPLRAKAAPAAPPAEPSSLDTEEELGEVERAWEVSNPAALEGGVASAPTSARENRLRSPAEPEARPGEAGRAAAADVASEEAAGEAVDAAFARQAIAPARSLAVDRCSEWREQLGQTEDAGSESLEARYQVAMCSLEEFEAAPSDEGRELALRDVEAFLERESDSERAAEVRRRSEPLRQ